MLMWEPEIRVSFPPQLDIKSGEAKGVRKSEDGVVIPTLHSQPLPESLVTYIFHLWSHRPYTSRHSISTNTSNPHSHPGNWVFLLSPVSTGEQKAEECTKAKNEETKPNTQPFDEAGISPPEFQVTKTHLANDTDNTLSTAPSSTLGMCPILKMVSAEEDSSQPTLPMRNRSWGGGVCVAEPVYGWAVWWDPILA